jgi:hypothetical protein
VTYAEKIYRTNIQQYCGLEVVELFTPEIKKTLRGIAP